MTHKILVFAPGFVPYAASENIVNGKLVLAMKKKGWHVDVISRCDSDYYGSRWEAPWLPLREHTHEVVYPHGSGWIRTIERFVDVAKTGQAVAGVRWARRALEHALELHHQQPYQVVISRSTPDVAHLPAMLFSRHTSLPWIANWNDPTAMKMPAPYGGGLDAKPGFFQERFLASVAAKANYHTFPSERLRRYISGYLDIEEGRSIVVPHIGGNFDPDFSASRSGVFTICHAGHLDDKRNPDAFLEGLGLFAQRMGGREQVKFVNIGLDNAGLRKKAERFGVTKHLEVTGALGYLQTLAILRASSLLLVIEAPCAEGIFLPSKFVDYVETGRPILSVSPEEGTLHDILSSRGGGICVPVNSATKITEALEVLFSSWQQEKMDEIYGSTPLYRYYAPETVLMQYENLFAGLGLTP